MCDWIISKHTVIRALSWAFNCISSSANFMAQVSSHISHVKPNNRWSYMMIRSLVLVQRWTLDPDNCPHCSLFSHPPTPTLWPLTSFWSQLKFIEFTVHSVSMRCGLGFQKHTSIRGPLTWCYFFSQSDDGSGANFLSQYHWTLELLWDISKPFSCLSGALNQLTDVIAIEY